MLQVIQNTAARIITGTKLRENITPEFKKLHWLPLVAKLQMLFGHEVALPMDTIFAPSHASLVTCATAYACC
jgi:hypothetical protein